MRYRIFDSLFYISIGAFVLAMPLHAFSAGGEGIPGWACLLLGWWGLFSGSLSWLANPLLICGWLLRSHSPKPFLVAAGVAIVLMLSFLGADTVAINEGGVPNEITRIGVGYWLWLASGLLACADALCRITIGAEALKSE